MSTNPYKATDSPAGKTEATFTPFRGWRWFVPLHIIFLIFAVVVYFVVAPQMLPMFEEFGVELPVATQWLFRLSNLGPLLLVCFIGIQTFVIGLFFGFGSQASLSKLFSAWKFATTCFWLVFLGLTLVAIFWPLQSIIDGLSN